MPIERSEAFILNTLNFRDQDKIVTLFTQDKGIIRGIAKGARKFGNRFGSSLELLSHVNAVYYDKEGRDLVIINQCDLKESFFDVQHSTKAAFTLGYFSELVQGFSQQRAREDLVFRLLHKTLHALHQGGNLELLSAYFEAWILKINGFIPDFKTCRKCGVRIRESSWLSPRKDGIYCLDCAPQKKIGISADFSSFLDWIKKNPPPIDGTAQLPFPEENIKANRKILQELLVFHMERKPKSLRFL